MGWKASRLKNRELPRDACPDLVDGDIFLGPPQENLPKPSFARIGSAQLAAGSLSASSSYMPSFCTAAREEVAAPVTAPPPGLTAERGVAGQAAPSAPPEIGYPIPTPFL